MKKQILLSLVLFAFSTGCALTTKNNSELSGIAAKSAIHKMAGCYLVDYSYVESEALKNGYTRDARIYDVNKDKAVKEWIYAEDISFKRIRLQHILFSTDQMGQVVAGSELKHQAEDWEFEAPFQYEYLGASNWVNKPIATGAGNWVRRVTSLDDGLRYQCAAPWNLKHHYPEWTCTGYAPIPGRETRDMGRKDYQGLNRTTRIIVYNNSWVERQDNTKTIENDNKQVPLAKEVGKNWYVRLPDKECAPIQEFVKGRQEFWTLLRSTWDDVFKDGKPVAEKSTKPPRFVKMMELEDTYIKQDLKDPAVRKQAREAILQVIREYSGN